MPRMTEIADDQAGPGVRELFRTAKERNGVVPNVFRAMAHSPAVLSAFMEVDRSLQTGVLGRPFQQQIAVAVAYANRSPYCLAINTAVGRHAGLTEAELLEARRGRSADPKRQEGLRFVGLLIESRGRVDDADLTRLRAAGYTEQELAELIGNVAFNLFANYFNLVSESTLDFPAVEIN